MHKTILGKPKLTTVTEKNCAETGRKT